uniref:Uncharacterized protein n=1 Tax=Arundo donax TaxID=35708 RepID=A0A0A9BBB5_ARUDO
MLKPFSSLFETNFRIVTGFPCPLSKHSEIR